MRRFLLLGNLLIACCGCAASGAQRVDITAPRANLAHRRAAPPVGPAASGAQADESQRHAVVRVFYGTDRARQANRSLDEPGSEQRGPLEFGYCHVSIPAADVSDEELPRIWRCEFTEGTTGQTALLGDEPVDRGTFTGELRSDVNESGTGETFVFVHGRDVDFDEAVRQTARIAHDLRFDGPPILYSWPSGADDSIADPTAVLQSRSHLAWFLQTVAQESDASKVHLIAHSAGTQLLASVLQQMADTSPDGARFHEVVLADAEIDAETFASEIATRIVRVARRVTVYASDDDPGSARRHGANRLGRGGAEPDVIADLPGIDVVDVAARELRFLEAGRADDGSALLGDIRQVLDGVATTQRGLQPHPGRQPAWRLPASEVRLASHTGGGEHTHEETEAADPTESVANDGPWRRLTGWWPW